MGIYFTRGMAVIIGWCSGVAASAADGIAIDLGGPRQAIGTLTITDSEYWITVRMRPVTSFDLAMNAQLNRDKARQLAFHALGRHLARQDAVVLTVTGATVVKTATDASGYSLTLRVPRQGVSWERIPKRAELADELKPVRVPPTSHLLTRKSDYDDTLAQLVQWSETRVQSLKWASLPKAALYMGVADIEEQCVNNLRRLAKEVAPDRLLLSIEKDQLADTIRRHEGRILDQLKQVVNTIESRQEKK